MPRHPNKISSLDQFLMKSGVLAKGEEHIKQAKKEYWNKQKAEWRKNQRLHTKTIAITFSLPQFRNITKQAKKHSLKPTQFARQIVLSYGEQKTLPLEPMIGNYIREALMVTYHAIRDLRNANKLSGEIEKVALEQLEAVSRLIKQSIEHPKRIESAIAELVSEQPEIKQRIIELLNTL